MIDLEQNLVTNQVADKPDPPTEPSSAQSIDGAAAQPHSNGATPNGATSNEQAELAAAMAELNDQAWTQSLLRPALIAVAAVCLVLAMLAFIRRLVPGLPPAYTELLVVVGALASILGSITTTWLAQPGQRSRRSTGYRAAELALILGVTRIGTWIAAGSWPGFNQFLLRPVDSLLDPYFLLGAFVVLLAWIMSTAMTDDLLAMALQPDDLYASRTFGDRWQDTARPVYTDRPAILRRFVARWVVGGIILVILAAGSRYDLPESGFLGVIRQNIDPVVIGAIIIYFLVGLALISQGQLALLRARWILQRTPSAPGVLQNWPLYAIMLLLVIAVVAALLPLGGTFRLAQIITAVLGAIYFVLFGAFRLFLGLLLMLMSWLTGEPMEEPPQAPPPMPTFAPEPPPQTEAVLPPWTGGVIFWAFAAAILLYAAYIYFSGKGANFDWLRRVWAMLRARWQLLFGAYQDWQAARIRERALRAAQEGEEGQGSRLPNWLRWRNLDPDRQVRYYYLSILQRAAEAGMPRQVGETPARYAPRLAEKLEAEPEERAAIEELTEAFVQVRYAGTHVAPDRLARAKQAWEATKRLLRL